MPKRDAQDTVDEMRRSTARLKALFSSLQFAAPEMMMQLYDEIEAEFAEMDRWFTFIDKELLEIIEDNDA